MGATTFYGWPYPDPGSDVDVPRDIKALADDIDSSAQYFLDPPIVQVRQATAQSIPNNLAAYTALTFTNEEIDPLDMHSGNGTRLTVKVAGVYRLTGAACLAGNATGSRRAGWWLNDANMIHAVASIPGSTSGANVLTVASVLVSLAVNQWIELRVFQDSGAALNTAVGNGNQSWASMQWIRP
jgi:hypothetical protein